MARKPEEVAEMFSYTLVVDGRRVAYATFGDIPTKYQRSARSGLPQTQEELDAIVTNQLQLPWITLSYNANLEYHLNHPKRVKPRPWPWVPIRDKQYYATRSSTLTTTRSA